MNLPEPRGALSSTVFEYLCSDARSMTLPIALCESEDDAQITLWALYELHYRGFDNVAEDREWDPSALDLRCAVERRLEAELRAAYGDSDTWGSSPSDLPEALGRLIEAHDGPSVAQFLHRQADHDDALEILRHRSIYHLKEADPSAWVVPRVRGATKVALMELQFDEYGAGDPARLHSTLFAVALDAAGLRPDYGSYIDEAPSTILRMNNIVTFFGLHRRLRGAALGHLAAFESTSSIPSAQIAHGLRRLGFPEATVAYYDEHVVADAVHEQLAIRQICGTLVRAEPALREQVLLGAFSCLDAEDRYARHLLSGDLVEAGSW